jgi:hypothetical protein
VTKAAKQRAQQIAYAVAMGAKALPGIQPANLKQMLELEAAKPLRGGAKELGADGLFGDGMKQGGLF